jgi:uncharacterized damage-inducible protein DinB
MAPSVDELELAVVSEASYRLIESTKKIRHCLNQLSDEQVWWRQAESQNSIGNIIFHLCGNVRQWIISGIGGEPGIRDRPNEFSERRVLPKHELLRQLDEVVQQACAALESHRGVRDRTPVRHGGPGLVRLTQRHAPLIQWKDQRHARKNHSHMWVFTKGG